MAAPATLSTQRFLRGPAQTVAVPAASGQQINVGDLTYWRSGNACPVSAFVTLSGNELQSWSGARSLFLGVSLSQWNSNYTQSGTITVALDGIFSYPGKIASGTTYQPGTFVGMTMDQSSGYFHPQQLMQCSGQASCIGKVVEQLTTVASGVGDLHVYLQSTVAKGVIAGV